MISAIISRLIILLFGTLYPAYASYKAVRTKNVKEYVKWMMYWIVYAFFTCIETFTDIFLSWFPFYYEIKVLIVLWLLSPATKGSSTLYRKFVHPMLTRREPEIDEYINQAKEKGYTAVLQLGSKGVNYATNVIMQTALKGGGNLVQTIRRSYSLSDLSEPDDQRTQDEIDEVGRPHQRLLRPRSQTARSSSGGRNVDMYFSEVDCGPKAPPPNFNHVRSTDDISSGYSSAEPVSTGLSRTASLTNATRPRFKAKRAEDNIYFESDEYESMPEVRLLATNNLDTHVPSNSNHPKYSPNISLVPPNNMQTSHNDNIANWKNQAFFDNEKYFQDQVLAKLIENKHSDDVSAVSNISVDSCNSDNAMKTRQEDKVEDVTENTSKLIRKKDEGMKGKSSETDQGLSNCKLKVSNEFDFRNPASCSKLNETERKEAKPDVNFSQCDQLGLLSTGYMADKYERFCKWLEDNEKSHQLKELNIPISNTLTSTSQTYQQDFFKDTSSGSEEDIFHDPQVIETSMEDVDVKLNELISSKNKVSGNEMSKRNESVDSASGEISLPLILDDFSASRKSSASDIKRPATHHKGRAPSPPKSIDPMHQMLISKNENATSFHEKEISDPATAVNLPTSVTGLNEFSSSHDRLDIRPSSPRSDTKPKTGKINLFKGYLPALFRPESPKPKLDNSNDAGEFDDRHKETEI